MIEGAMLISFMKSERHPEAVCAVPLEVDFLVPGGTTPITVVARAVHGSFMVQTVPRGIVRVGIKGESVGSCDF